MTDPREEKILLRKSFKALRAKIDTQQKRELDRAIFESISQLACFRFADTLLLFYPIGSEIDLLPLATLALAHNKKVAFPVSDPNSSNMVFRYVSDLESLRVGAYTIHEPPEDAPEFGFESNSLCIVPALSFDKDGYRVGYGKGYYDRFLKKFSGTALGAVYECLLKDSLPRGYYDVPVDIIITERRTIITNAKKRTEANKH